MWEEPKHCSKEGHVGKAVEVRNGYDQVIGGQCSTCLGVLWCVGKCRGCGKDDVRLRYVVGEGRYCDRDCRTAEMKREQEEEQAAHDRARKQVARA